MRNVAAVREAVSDYERTLPHLQEIVGALWLRSIAVGNLAGAEPAMLQTDITRDRRVDDNAFQAELATIVSNSFNIHNDGPRLVFREEENPQAKLMACARNDRLFADRSDFAQLAKEVRYVIGGSDGAASRFHIISLPLSWVTDPWSGLEEGDHPDRWDDRLPLLILPEGPDRLHERLGRWLKDHLQKRRNTVRFIIPRSGSDNIFSDRDLLILARAEMKAQEWSAQSPEYGRLQKKCQGELRDLLKQRFDRFAILQSWNYGDPALCQFRIERINAQGAQVPDRIEQVIAEDLFVPEDFDDFILEAADNSAPLGKVLRELQEPRPGGKDCIPWLGETLMKERVLRLCARGAIAINVRNLEYLQAAASEDEAAAWKRLRSKLAYTGRHLDEIYLHRPGAVPATGASPATPVPAPTAPSGGLFGSPSSPASPGISASPGITGTSQTPSSEPPSGPIAGGIFGAPSSGAPKVYLANPPTSPLNLIGKLESWGVGPATQVSDVTIKVSAANGAQLKDILRKLPDGMTFELSLEKENQ